MFIIYGIGFFAVFIILAMMNLRAYILRQELELNLLEKLMTRAEVVRCVGIALVGLLSVLMGCVLSGGAAGLAGLSYFLIGVVEFMVGWRFGNKREVLLRQEKSRDVPQDG